MEPVYMMSINPEWLKLELRGKKLAEVRKSAPRLKPGEGATVYVYETRRGGGRGAVVARFHCPAVHRIDCWRNMATWETWSRMSCLGVDDLMIYRGNGRFLAFWEIEGIEELPEILPATAFGLKRPPQSWCKVPELPLELVGV